MAPPLSGTTPNSKHGARVRAEEFDCADPPVEFEDLHKPTQRPNLDPARRRDVNLILGPVATEMYQAVACPRRATNAASARRSEEPQDE